MQIQSNENQPEKFYAIFIDLKFGRPLQEMMKAKSESEFDDFLKNVVKPVKWIHDVGIQEVDGTISILTFKKLKERYFAELNNDKKIKK
jgi:hypothetical protein